MAAKKAAQADAGTKQVIALRDGYYGQYIESGQVFEVPTELKAKWFVDATPVQKPADEAGDLV